MAHHLQIGWTPALHNGSDDEDEIFNEGGLSSAVPIRLTDPSHREPWLQTIIAFVSSNNDEQESIPSLASLINQAIADEVDMKFIRDLLFEVFQSGSKSDCIIRTSSGMNHKVHRCVIASHSEYFHACLSGRWTVSADDTNNTTEEKTVPVLTLSDCDDEHLILLLEYFYTGDMTQLLQPVSVILPCLMLAHLLMVKEVTITLGEALHTSLNKHNALELYIVADRLAFKTLKTKALNMLIKHFHELYVIPPSAAATTVPTSTTSSVATTVTIDTDSDSSTVAGSTLSASTIQIQESLTEQECAYLQILNAFYRRAQDRGISIDASISRISEVLAITLESIDDAMERYVEARQQNDDDITECTASIAASQTRGGTSSNSSGGIAGAVTSVLNFWQRKELEEQTKLTERLARLNKVRSALNRQQHYIEMQRAFYERQKTAYDNLTEIGREELRLRQQQQQQQMTTQGSSSSSDGTTSMGGGSSFAAAAGLFAEGGYEGIIGGGDDKFKFDFFDLDD